MEANTKIQGGYDFPTEKPKIPYRTGISVTLVSTGGPVTLACETVITTADDPTPQLTEMLDTLQTTLDNIILGNFERRIVYRSDLFPFIDDRTKLFVRAGVAVDTVTGYTINFGGSDNWTRWLKGNG